MIIDKIGSLIIILVTLLFFAFGIYSLVELSSIEYPSSEELEYYDLTFKEYEYKTNLRGRNHRYFISVSEFEEELIIDNIVISKVDKELLDVVEENDTVKVSYQVKKDKKYIYEIIYDNEYILSYQDYVSKHTSNNRIGMIGMSIISVLSFGTVIYEIIYFIRNKKIIHF